MTIFFLVHTRIYTDTGTQLSRLHSLHTLCLALSLSHSALTQTLVKIHTQTGERMLLGFLRLKHYWNNPIKKGQTWKKIESWPERMKEDE